MTSQIQCKLKKICLDQSQPLYNCWREDCDGRIHVACTKLTLDRCEIKTEDHPNEEDKVDDEPVVFCAKTCYLKWRSTKNRAIKAAKKGEELSAKKRKVPWEEDGSLSVLMDWLTTHGNYAQYCGANSNKGKTKTAYHKLIADLVKQKKPESERNEKDVENKITSLERQFRKATDWASNTGAGVENPGAFEAAVLQRCPLYKELEPIMGERPNAKPLASNESDSEDDSSGDGFSNEKPTAVDRSIVAVGTAVDHSIGAIASTPSPAGRDLDIYGTCNPTTSSVSSSKSAKSASKRLSATTTGEPKKKAAKQTPDDFISSYLGGSSDSTDKESLHALRVREVSAREKEADARMLEATCNSEKTKKETAILSIDERVKLIRERAKLIEDGICTEDNIDNFLPLK